MLFRTGNFFNRSNYGQCWWLYIFSTLEKNYRCPLLDTKIKKKVWTPAILRPYCWVRVLLQSLSVFSCLFMIPGNRNITSYLITRTGCCHWYHCSFLQRFLCCRSVRGNKVSHRHLPAVNFLKACKFKLHLPFHIDR